MKEKVLAMTNDFGKKFFGWISKYEILGIERTSSNASRKEFTVVYKYPNGNISTAVFPDAGTTDNGSCFFGDLDHFARCYAADMAKCKMNYSFSRDVPMYEKDWAAWHRFYEEMIQKYSR